MRSRPSAVVGQSLHLRRVSPADRAVRAAVHVDQQRAATLARGQPGVDRHAVGRALLTRPAIIFGDEPTGNLDSKTSAEVMQLLRHSVDEFGQTVIMVTHDPVAAAHADRLITLRDGRIVHDAAPGSADEVIELMKQID